MKKIKILKNIDAAVTYIILIAVAVIFFFPCLWLILASFSKSGSIYSFSGFFPKEYSFDSFKTLFTDTNMYNYPKWFLNTLFVSVMTCILGSTLTILTAYSLSRFNFKSRKLLLKSIILLNIFPAFMGMIAVYLIMTQLDLVNNLWGLIFIYSAGAPLGCMVQKGFFDTVSNSLSEAARIDGANNMVIFIKIILPISKPIIVYTALILFAWPWSDFLLPKLLLKQKDLYTVAVGLMSLGEVEFARFAAGSVFIAVPIIIMYFFLIKYMVYGLTSGAVKE